MTGRIAIANAPCSWGVVEGFESSGAGPGYAQVLDEMAQAGYSGTELGDWGFMPTDAETLRAELARRGLSLVGAYVPVALTDPAAHAAGEAAALRTAALLAACTSDGQPGAPVVVLADDNATDAARTSLAGRVQPEHGLSKDQWAVFARGAGRIARAVRDQSGLRTVFHNHCGGFIETPLEVARLLDLTDPELIGLCLDTGHYTYGGGDALDALKRFGDRVWHVHFKDCDAGALARMRSDGWSYVEAVRRGIFCELGNGVVDFPSVVDELRAREYRGWIVVEDEVAPGMGTPLESAQRDRAFLGDLGL